jgi:hypothetical protein
MKAWAADLSAQLTEAHWQRLAAWIKTHYDPVIIERLVEQCPEEILFRLTEELSGFAEDECKVVLDDLIALYNLFTGKAKESIRATAWKDSFTALINATPSSEAFYDIIKEAYLQRQIKTDITRPVELQQIQALLHSEIVQQTMHRFAAGIEKETYQHEAKKEIAIDGVANADGDINASAEIIESTHTAGEEAPGKDSTENENLAEENLHAEDTRPGIKNDNIHSKEQDVLNEGSDNAIEDKTGSKAEEADTETTYSKEEQQRLLQKQEQKKKRPPAIAENEPQYVNNCGVIILHPFLQKYLAELGLIEERAFVSMEACKRAVLLLHFLASEKQRSRSLTCCCKNCFAICLWKKPCPGSLIFLIRKKKNQKICCGLLSTTGHRLRTLLLPVYAIPFYSGKASWRKKKQVGCSGLNKKR